MAEKFPGKKINDYVSVCDSNGWQWINEFVGKEESIMFFNESDEKKSFVFKDGADLTTVLSETYGFEFYVTNKQTSFLIAFNNHDYLIACGTAKKWLKSKANDCRNR